MQKVFKIIFGVVLSFSIISCGGSSKKSEAKVAQDKAPSFLDAKLDSCDQASRNRFIYDFMQDSYYWALEVPRGLDASRFDSEDELLSVIKNKKDHFSFILDLSLYDSVFESDMGNDFGILSDLDENNLVRVLYVAPNSPAFDAGIRRSDRLEFIDKSDDNKSIRLTVISKDKTREVTLNEKSFLKKEVSNVKIFDLGDKKVGYFVLNSFIGENIKRDLDEVFGQFKKEGVDELILDLRYNGGGKIDIATHLASLISGKKSFSHIFQHHVFNSKYSQYNEDSYFDRYTKNALDLKRVFVITTANTASASESVISALRAKENNMDVIIVGDRTYGKPYGMYPIKYCDKVFFPIMMKNFNTDYDNYDEGFEPTCKAVDDKERDFADENEESLNSALYYIKNGRCR